LIYKIAFYFTLAVIEYLATTTVEIKLIESIWDKANHFSAFFVLYILLSLAYTELTTRSKAVLLLLFGMQIEVVQSFIDGRYFSMLDVVADSVGILLGVLFFRVGAPYILRLREHL